MLSARNSEAVIDYSKFEWFKQYILFTLLTYFIKKFSDNDVIKPVRIEHLIHIIIIVGFPNHLEQLSNNSVIKHFLENRFEDKSRVNDKEYVIKYLSNLGHHTDINELISKFNAIPKQTKAGHKFVTYFNEAIQNATNKRAGIELNIVFQKIHLDILHVIDTLEKVTALLSETENSLLKNSNPFYGYKPHIYLQIIQYVTKKIIDRSSFRNLEHIVEVLEKLEGARYDAKSEATFQPSSEDIRDLQLALKKVDHKPPFGHGKDFIKVIKSAISSGNSIAKEKKQSDKQDKSTSLLLLFSHFRTCTQTERNPILQSTKEIYDSLSQEQKSSLPISTRFSGPIIT